MKLRIFMDISLINTVPNPNVPGPDPTCSNQSPPHNIPPHRIATTPPPLMSITTYPELESAIVDVTSPPRKWRRKEYKEHPEMASYKKLFERKEDNWQRFFIMSKKEGDFSKMSPFLYCSLIINAIGKPKSVQKMATGSLSIEAISTAQAKLLTELKMLGNDEIVVTSNKRLNTSKGVVVCRDFMVCSEEEIKIGMADQGVIEVKRINRRQGGSLVATASLILTFDRPDPPEQIEAAFYKLKVRRYIPSPMRCFKCLKFGHTSLRCRSAGQVCVCGLFVHENAPCQDPPICVNCADKHSSRSPECVIFKEEKEIQRIKTLQNVPYYEAKEIVQTTNYVRPNVSYASVSKTKQIERKDWQKFLQPFIFSANQGPSKPVWSAQKMDNHVPPSPKEVPTQPSEVRVSHPLTSEIQGSSLVSLPSPLPAASAAGRHVPEFKVPVRLSSSRLPQRSPPRKGRSAKPSLATKSLTQLGPERKEKVNAVESPQPSVSLLPCATTINWSSSREDNDTDPDSGDSNRTVLTDAGQIPMERPVVRRKRKGRPRTPKK